MDVETRDDDDDFQTRIRMDVCDVAVGEGRKLLNSVSVEWGRPPKTLSLSLWTHSSSYISKAPGDGQKKEEEKFSLASGRKIFYFFHNFLRDMMIFRPPPLQSMADDDDDDAAAAVCVRDRSAVTKSLFNEVVDDDDEVDRPEEVESDFPSFLCFALRGCIISSIIGI